MAERILGLEIGGTKCTVWLFEGETILDHETRITIPQSEPCLDMLGEMADGLLKDHPGDLAAVGISCGGPLDAKTGHILCPPNLPLWLDVAITDWAQKRFGVPARLQNDADANALAEWRYGAGKGTQSMIFLTFGTGLGSGLILNGRLWSGAGGMGGEIGHVRLAEQGPVGYGKIGSAEGFCSGGGIAQLAAGYALAARQQGQPVPWEDDPSAKNIAMAAFSGEKTAIAVYERVGEMLGRTLSLLVDLLNPERIVIGSIYARSHALMDETMARVMQTECLPASLAACRVVPAALGEEIGAYGCLAAATYR